MADAREAYFTYVGDGAPNPPGCYCVWAPVEPDNEDEKIELTRYPDGEIVGSYRATTNGWQHV
jgi:hypothetical protein